jgi:flagellar motor switch protein FliN/FliY
MKEQDRAFERFKDVHLKVSFVVGTKKMSLSKVLKLKEGDIIELDRKLEDYLDVYINEQKFGIGELIVVNDKFSLRLVDLV